MYHAHGKRIMRIAILLYGIVCYVMFLGTFIYAIGFTTNWIVPKGIDSGEVATPFASAIINVLLLSIFGIQHTIMARPAFKAWFTKIIPASAERSTFVLLTNLILCLIFWQWQPLPEMVWDVSGSTALTYGLWTVCGLGWLLVLYSTFLINHLDLFGLRQVGLFYKGIEYTDAPFVQPWFYTIIRNPMMLGFIIAFWATPTMSQGHLLFSLVTTGYIFFGVTVEERDLADALGEEYIAFRARTPLIIPFLKFGRGDSKKVDGKE
jgi:methanethiol S-methyltransferase